MLTEHSMVYFAPDTWHGLWQPRQQLMQDFARHGNKVLYVEARSHLRAALQGMRNGTAGQKHPSQPVLHRINENLHVLHYPAWAPVSGRMPIGWLTKMIRTRILRNVLRALQMERPIVWLSQPSMIDLIDEVPAARLYIYHILDEYSAYAGQTSERSQRIARAEQEIYKHVDAVIVVSQQLYEAKQHHHPHMYVVPNGVNYDAFSKALDDLQLPEDLARVPSPRIGYSGHVGDRLNLPMLHELALAKPEWSLVFMGEARLSQQLETWQAMLRLPNVHYLGQKPGAEVPNYLKGFQVGLMPYLQNRESEHISPLKLYDYLAAGLAVVSVEIPAIKDFRQHIHVARTPSDFMRAVEMALADKEPHRYAMRRAVAAQHTWEAREQLLSNVIQQQLASA